VVERGRDGSRFTPVSGEERLSARRALGIAPDSEVIVTLGRQEEQKGHRYLLEAIASMRSRRPRLVALFAGRSGEVSAQLEAQRTSLGLEGVVRFLGFRDDVGELLAATDVFVFPSLWEGLGGSLIEAMARALPIVASDIDAVREVVEDGRSATLVPPASPERLAAAVEALLGDPQRLRTFGVRGREIFEERFTLDRTTERMADLYRKVAGNAVGARRDRSVHAALEPSARSGPHRRRRA
jgi:glycosyltransferase involved in cell wall biosynthesis